MVSGSLDQTVRVWDISGEGLGDSSPEYSGRGFFGGGGVGVQSGTSDEDKDRNVLNLFFISFV